MPPARVSAPADKVKRQSTYPDALQTRADLSIFYGRYQLNPFTCRSCGHVHNVPNETMTDVNIAVELMFDLLNRRIRVTLQQLLDRHHHAGRAEAALQAVIFLEGLLDWMQSVPVCKAFHGLDPGSICLHRKDRA